MLERRTERVTQSRALAIHGRTLEVFVLRGLADRFLARGRSIPSASVRRGNDASARARQKTLYETSNAPLLALRPGQGPQRVEVAMNVCCPRVELVSGVTKLSDSKTALSRGCAKSSGGVDRIVARASLHEEERP